MMPIIWLRDENKPFEERCILTPTLCQRLLKKGFKVVVERSSKRIFDDSDYNKAGCQIVESNTWPMAPLDSIIVGLKELNPDDRFPLIHRHIHFAHAYKGQKDADIILRRFKEGGGVHYDLEYLTYDDGKRIAAFGVWAGFVGAALAVDIWCEKQRNTDYNSLAPLSSWKDQFELIENLKTKLENKSPKAIIIGSSGRCGQGAADLFTRLGIESKGLRSRDTLGRGPLKEILDFDIFINCVFIQKKISPFITNECLLSNINLSVISDVSCDPTGDYNPIPLYDNITTMDRPVINLDHKNISGQQVSLTAIDHLPSLLPKESSEDYGSQLIEHLEDFFTYGTQNRIFKRAQNIFEQKCSEALKEINLKYNQQFFQSHQNL